MIVCIIGNKIPFKKCNIFMQSKIMAILTFTKLCNNCDHCTACCVAYNIIYTFIPGLDH